MPRIELADNTPALCISCGEKATLSIFSRIWQIEITICKACANENQKTINEIPIISEYFNN